MAGSIFIEFCKLHNRSLFMQREQVFLYEVEFFEL